MHVVLADPSRTVQKAIGQMLEVRGHKVAAFADGPSALAHLRADESVDALITCTTPLGMSGVELCWEARVAAGGRRPLYVIMMSSNPEKTTLCEALDSGADDFVIKPPAPEELYARMRAAERFAAMERDLVRLATTDPLTGVLNRRAFFDGANAAVAQAGGGSPLAAIMIDIDHFKRINDQYGHARGDQTLCDVTRIMTTEAPAQAILGRLGGEEFALVVPNASLSDAAALAEKLRARTEALRHDLDNVIFSMTCSFGVACWRPGDMIDSLLKRADDALYRAKHSGRNRVIIADETVAAVHNPYSVIRSPEQSDAAASPTGNAAAASQDNPPPAA